MNELAKKLSEMYRNGWANGEAMAQVVLFGIKYAEEIRAREDPSLTAVIEVILEESGIQEGKTAHTYVPEIHQGMTLARYVKPRRRERLR